MAARYTAAPFAHDGAVALALAPALAVAVLSSGGAGGGVGLAGCLLAYVLDLLRLPEATLGALWATLCALYLCLVFGGGGRGPGDAPPPPALLEVLSLLLLGQTLFLAGVWATLQARAAREPSSAPRALTPPSRLRSSASCTPRRPASSSPPSACCWQPPL